MQPETGQGWTARFATSIAEIDRVQWDACFKGEIEGYGYHRGIEHAGIGGFGLGWYVLEEGGDVIAAVPMFETRYDLATTAQGTVRTILTRMQPWIPGQLKLGLSCLGSPVTETCQLGFAPRLDDGQKQLVLAALVQFWRQHAVSRGIGLHGLKDVSQADRVVFEPALARFGFRLVPSMPSASLKIDFPDIESYMSRLSPSTRKDMRRKLKFRDRIRVEDTRDVRNVLPDILEMYRETRSRSDWAFEDLEASYFSSVLELSENAFFKLYWAGSRLVGANMLLSDGNVLLDKFFVMRGTEGRDLNLYFLSWFENVSHCLAHGLATYRSGQAGYESKIKLASVLHPAWIGFSHWNPVIQSVLRWAAPMLAVDQPKVKTPNPAEPGS